jgi:hypothetical protein
MSPYKDTDEENTRQHMVDILQAVMETHVLNPHEVPKCSQLYLVLAQFKANDLKQFRQNLCVSTYI